MPYERDELNRAIALRARKSLTGSEVFDTRGSVRGFGQAEALASDANAQFIDQSGETILGIDDTLGSMTT